MEMLNAFNPDSRLWVDWLFISLWRVRAIQVIPKDTLHIDARSLRDLTFGCYMTGAYWACKRS